MRCFDDKMIEKAKSARSAEDLLEIAKANNVELTAEDAATYFAQLNPKCGELGDDELNNVSGGGCSSSVSTVYDDSMQGKRGYHPTSGNTYIILGPCPDDATKALIKNVCSGDEGYVSLATLVIE